MKKGHIIIISGPSGSGKTTLYKSLLKRNKSLVKTISVTTRPKRRGEEHGRDYFFISEKMFAYKKKRGHFLETQKVFDNYYGTPNKSVKEFLKAGKNVLLCIDVKGAKVVCRKFLQADTIFIKPPSLTELKKRLKIRASEDEATIQLRLTIASKELKEASRYNYIVVNDDLKKAREKLGNIVSKILFFDKTSVV